MKPAPAPAPPLDVSRKLKAHAFDIVTASQRLLTQTTAPVAFYSALADLILFQKRALQSLPGSDHMVADLDRMLDSVEAATEIARPLNKW